MRSGHVLATTEKSPAKFLLQSSLDVSLPKLCAFISDSLPSKLCEAAAFPFDEYFSNSFIPLLSFVNVTFALRLPSKGCNKFGDSLESLSTSNGRIKFGEAKEVDESVQLRPSLVLFQELLIPEASTPRESLDPEFSFMGLWEVFVSWHWKGRLVFRSVLLPSRGVLTPRGTSSSWEVGLPSGESRIIWNEYKLEV